MSFTDPKYQEFLNNSTDETKKNCLESMQHFNKSTIRDNTIKKLISFPDMKKAPCIDELVSIIMMDHHDIPNMYYDKIMFILELFRTDSIFHKWHCIDFVDDDETILRVVNSNDDNHSYILHFYLHQVDDAITITQNTSATGMIKNIVHEALFNDNVLKVAKIVGAIVVLAIFSYSVSK